MRFFLKTVVLVSLFLTGALLPGEEISFEKIKGAKRFEMNTGIWELGWVPPSSGKTYPVKGLEGIAYKDFSNKIFDENTVITLKDMDLKKAELPLLGIKGDYYITISRDLECPVRYYANDGKIALERWTRSIYASCYLGNRAEQLKWLNSKNKVEDRKKILGYPKNITPRNVLIDSRWLDNSFSGIWNADPMMQIRNYKIPMKIAYILFLPASVLEFAMKEEWKKGAEISFECLLNGKFEKKSFLLDPAYMPETGNLRIGFVGTSGAKTYIVQNPGEGKDGIIIGSVNTEKSPCLSVKQNSVKVTRAVWRPYDRIAVDIRKHIGYEGCPDNNEFEAFDLRDGCDWGYLMSYIKVGNKSAGSAYPKRNPFTSIREDMVEREKKDALKTAYKYGMRIAFDINEDITPGNYIPDKYKGEILNPETGKFVKADFRIWANPEAVSWEGENIKERVRAYKGLPEYLMLHEGIGEEPSDNMSRYALESFRKFASDPNAKFPVIPTSPETERTTNKPTEELIKIYTEWKLGYYRGELFMLGIFNAACEALKGGNFKGGCYFGSVEDGGAYFVPYIAKSPNVVLLCPENVRNSKQGIFQLWLDAAKKYPDRLKLMPHSYPMLVTASTETFIEWFEDIGLLPEVKGLILGGGGLVPKVLFEALAAKHYGKSRMSQEEADKVIDTLKKNGIFYLDKYPEKAMNTEKKLKGSGDRKTDMKNAGRYEAAKKKVDIDGDFKDWENLKQQNVEGEKHLLAKKELKGKEDLSFSFAASYDEKNLYFTIKVRDDKLVLRTNTLSGEGDEVQMFIAYLDNPLEQSITLGQNGMSFRFIPSKDYKHVYLGHRFLDAVPGSKSDFRILPDGYEIEASIPWANFKYKPAKGKLLPVELHVLDTDTPAGKVEKSMLWNAFDGKERPWSVKGTTQWGLFELQ